MAETTCPVFRPTEEEFKNFRRYMEEVVDPEAGKVGLCKIIPPPGWAARRRAATEELCKSVIIPSPISQCTSSTRSNGVYSVHLVEKPSITLAEFKEYADKRAPFPSSTASAGCPGAAAVGVRRGRSSGGSSRSVCGGSGEGIDDDGGWYGGGGRGYGGGYGVRYGSNYGLSEGTTAEESEVARRVRMFWRSLGPNSEAPMYGADTIGTLFAEDDDDAWNVGKLDTFLQLLKSNLPGITSPMLYAGMWRSMFAFHVEDVNLYSINYLHRGDPKSWYCIPPGSRKRFESLAQAFFTEEFRTCKDHLRHKTTMISPLQIQRAGIGYCTAVQGAGEFMITFPAAYHGGFNHGFNLAESTNFAIDRWIKEGRAAGYCRCSPHSVRIDVDRLEDLVRQHRRIAGRDATCLNGLAEAPDDAALGPPTIVNDDSFPTKRVSKTKSSAFRGKELKAAVGGRASDVEASEEEEDLQVFHCVCNTNVRAVRGVRRRRDGTFVAIPLVAKGSAPWPEGEISNCPRCGVWGHKECLEYVLPPQFASPKGPPGSPVEVFPGAGLRTARVMKAKGDGEGLVPDRGKTRQRFKGARKSGGVSVVAQLEKGVGDEGACGERAEGGDVGSGEISGDGSFRAINDVVAPSASVDSAVPSSPPRPICWRCAQEKAEIASAAGDGIAGNGGTKVSPSRKSGKVSGSGGRRRGSGEVSYESENSLSTCITGDAGVVDGDNFDGEGFVKNDGVGGEREKRVAKKARLLNSVGVASADGSQGESGESKDSRDPTCTSTDASTEGQKGRSAFPGGGSKRARVGPRLLGKEVLVSDGMSAVLTGVVSAIEDGQARIHYRGRKAKLDEWINIYSERFLSTKEAKKQIQLAKLAMNSPAVDISEKLPPLGKKRKPPVVGGTDDDAADGVNGKRVKLEGGGNTGKFSSGKAKGEKRSDKSEPKETKGGGKYCAGVQKPTKKPSKVGKISSSTGGKRSEEGGKRTERVKNLSSSKKPKADADMSLGRGQKSVAVKKEQGVSCKGVLESKDGDGRVGKTGVGKGKRKSAGLEENSVTGKVKAKGKAKAEIRTKKLGKDEAGEVKASKMVEGKTDAVSKGGGVRGEAKGKKRVRTVGTKPAVVPPRPVVVRREVPKHHVISNRRAAVLARTFEKEQEDARKEYEEQVAAAERSRVAAEKRRKASIRHRSNEMLDEHEKIADVASLSSHARETVASVDDVTAVSGGQCSSSKSGGERWPSLGFGGKPWGLGPFLREVETEHGEGDEEDLSERVTGVKEEEAMSGESVAVKMPRALRAREVMMHRAKVEAGESVYLGDEEAFRAWLARLRAAEKIPIGHVKKCSLALAVALGTSPMDGSVRASIQALLIAETLRGGASEEVARFVRKVAGIIAEAASKARPVLSSPSARARNDNVANAEPESPASCDVDISLEREGTREGAAGGGEGYQEGGVSDPAAVAIRDMEGVAAYAHALAFIARSTSKQRRAWEAHGAVVADAAHQGGKLNDDKNGKKPEEQFEDLSPASSCLSPEFVGELPGSFPFFHSSDSLLLHVKAMVGLKRAHRWAKAWLDLPEGSSIDFRVSLPMETTGVTYARKTAAASGEPTEGVMENPLTPAYSSTLSYHVGRKTLGVEHGIMAATALAATAVDAQKMGVNGRSWLTEHVDIVSSMIPPQASRDASTVSSPGLIPVVGATPAPVLGSLDPATANTVAAPAVVATTASVPVGVSAASPVATSAGAAPAATLANVCAPPMIPWSFNNAFVSAIQRPIAGAAGTLANPAAAFAAAAAAAAATAFRFPAQQASVVAPNPWSLFPFGFGFGSSPPPTSSSGPLADPQEVQSVSAPMPLPGTSAPIPQVRPTPEPAVETPAVGSADDGADLLELWRLEGAGGGRGRGEDGNTSKAVGDEEMVVVDV